jgi:hypothetical protein
MLPVDDSGFPSFHGASTRSCGCDSAFTHCAGDEAAINLSVTCSKTIEFSVVLAQSWSDAAVDFHQYAGID